MLTHQKSRILNQNIKNFQPVIKENINFYNIPNKKNKHELDITVQISSTNIINKIRNCAFHIRQKKPVKQYTLRAMWFTKKRLQIINKI